MLHLLNVYDKVHQRALIRDGGFWALTIKPPYWPFRWPQARHNISRLEMSADFVGDLPWACEVSLPTI
jgi:hypothetical protein